MKRVERRQERRLQRKSDLQVMAFATMGVVVCMLVLLVWMHATQDLHGQLDKLQGGGQSDTSEAGRKEHLKAHILAKREKAEKAFHARLEAQRDADTAHETSRSPARCPPLGDWQGHAVCGFKEPSEPQPPLTIVTEHFAGAQEHDYLVPHYDELGTWLLSLQEPTLWNVIVNDSKALVDLHCGAKWLAAAQPYTLLGGVQKSVAEELRRAREVNNLQALLHDAEAARGIIASVAYNVEKLDGKDGEHPPQRLREVFSSGMEHAIDVLVPKAMSEWKVADIEAIHSKVCAGEPDVDHPGRIRGETLHVGFGFAMPPPLGFELRHLLTLFVEWLKEVDKQSCSDSVLHAVHAFSLLHRMQPFVDCNTRVAKVLLNTLLLRAGHPPVHMFLETSKKHLKELQEQMYSGVPNPLIDHIAGIVARNAARDPSIYKKYAATAAAAAGSESGSDSSSSDSGS